MSILLIIVILNVIVSCGMFFKKSKAKYLANITKTKELMSYLERGHLDYVDEKGKNILMIACSEEEFRVKKKDRESEYGFLDVAKRCIELGIDVNSRSTKSNTPLHYAINQEYNTEIVKYLISAGADINIPNDKGQTPFYVVCKMGDRKQYDMVKNSVNNINHQDKNGNTPLMIAARYGHPFIVHDLLDSGANIHLTTISGKNAYHIAVDYKQSHIKLGGNTATGVDTYGKHNHAINEMVRRLYCVINNKKYKPKKYKGSTNHPDFGNFE